MEPPFISKHRTFPSARSRVAIANNLARKGLDKIEKTSPLPQQPSEQIVSSAMDVVTSANDVSSTVSDAKDTVSDTPSSVVDKNLGLMQDSMDRTRAVVSSGVNSALSTSETPLEQDLPVPLAEDERGFVSANMAAAEVYSNQSVVERVSSLPLVSSTYGLMSSVYTNTKDTHPYIRTVCEAAEQGVRTITSVALSTASPIIDKLEPQIAIANNLACKGLDKIEKTLPILHQPSEQIVSSAMDVVTSAKDVVSSTVSDAKDTVSDTLSSVVDKTRGVMQDGMDRTRAVVSGSVSTVLESRVAQLVSSGVDSALSTSETLVEQYLPLTEDELELEAKTVRGFDRKEPSYYVRLGSLSTKVRKRAYPRAVAKIRDGKQRCLEFISELNTTVDLIEYGRKNINGANQKVNEKLNSLVWGSNGPNQPTGHEAEVIESRTLTLARSLTQQLQTTCLVLVSSLQGLPTHIQQEALSLSRSATQVYAGFSNAKALADLPDTVLTSSKVHLGKMKGSLDNVMDYLVNNTPLNWLVGPFYHRMGPEQSHAAPSATCSQSQQEERMEVEMESLRSQQW